MALVMHLNNLTLTWDRSAQRWVSQSGIQFTEADITLWTR